MERLRHDVAWAASASIIELFEPLLREEEQREAFAEIYQRVKAALEAYDLEADRTHRHLQPTRN